MPTVYRFFDADGDLLYIGRTASMGVRLAEHASTNGRSSHWFKKARTIKVEHFDSTTAAFHAEREAIRAEHPRFNVKHNTGADS